MQQDNLEPQPEVSALIRNGKRVLNSQGARATRKILTWALTLLMLLALAFGLLVTSLFFAAGGMAYGIGVIYWHVTMAAVGLLGAVAFVSKGHYAASLGYLVGSIAANYGIMLALFGISLTSPLLVIPLSLAWNGAYTYFAWRLLLAPSGNCPGTRTSEAHSPVEKCIGATNS